LIVARSMAKPQWGLLLALGLAASAVGCRPSGRSIELPKKEADAVRVKGAGESEPVVTRVSIFDTGVSSTSPYPGPALSQKSRWLTLPDNATDHRFKGDAVLTNGRLVVVLRRAGPGGEMYASGANGPSLRALLTPAAGDSQVRLVSVAIASNRHRQAALDAVFETADGASLTLSYELEQDQVFVKTQAGEGVGGLRVQAPCRFLVLPDFVADDMVIDARDLPMAEADLPGEHFLLHMLGRGDAILMTVLAERDEEFHIALSGQDSQRVISHCEIRYGEDGQAWVAVMEGAGVWHVHDVVEDEAGEVIPLDWKSPYPAHWRVDWRQADGLSDSWEMVTEQEDGRFLERGWSGNPTTLPADRKRQTSVLGRFSYPCWADRSGRGYFQALTKPGLRFQGPALIYPAKRVEATPLDTFTVVDVGRATLGAGPCEYILQQRRGEKSL
jgi:hypothetical protein